MAPFAAPAVDQARALASSSDANAALDRIWPLLEATPDDLAIKVFAARLLGKAGPVSPVHAPRLHALLVDPEIDPIPVARAGWDLLVAAGRLPSADEAGARQLEADAFTRALLAETCLAHPAAERALTALRRWLLLSGRASEFPNGVAALTAQAARNGGAWPFDAEERDRLAAADAAPLAVAYRPPRPAAIPAASPGDHVLSSQYEGWPYPVWERVMVGPGETLAGIVAALGPDAPVLPDAPDILVAGCGTGRETTLIARHASGARITAIDISAGSLAYAAQRCSAPAAGGIVFEQRNLREVAGLGRSFDCISCSGVLHHRPDPEAAWAALTEVLRPGGVMSIMVYSKVARMRIQAAQRRIKDLLDRPIDDDLLREVRARLLADPPHAITWSTDFASLAGVHDLLLNRHEDLFDVARIQRGVEALGLDFLGFHLPGAARRARYRAEHPHDPWFRDFQAWAMAEWREPELFAGMYRFWCRKPLD